MTRFRVLLLEEHGTEHTPTHFALQPPQAIFPACICACVLAVIDLMEDGEVREDGVTGDRGGTARAKRGPMFTPSPRVQEHVDGSITTLTPAGLFGGPRVLHVVV